jgi:hypothetical protein
MDAVETVRRVAPQVDRLFIGGHRAAAPYTAEVRRRVGFSGPTMLIDLRRQLLRPRGVGVDEIAVKQRYVDRATIERLLASDLVSGLVTVVDARYGPTERGREALDGFGEALRRGVRELWGRHLESARVAGSLIERVIVAAGRLDRGRYPAFFLEVEGPDEGDELLDFWTSVAALRYLRADAHALAWEERGLDAGQITSLTILCHKDGPLCVKDVGEAGPGDVEGSLAALRWRGWVESNGEKWRVTERGIREREAIERRTNDLNAPPFETLTATEREHLVQVLSMLPATASAGG